jgi:hypothetical protein
VNGASPTVNAAVLTFVALTTPRSPVAAAVTTAEATAAALNQIAPAAGGTQDDGATYGPFETLTVPPSDATTTTIAQSITVTPATPARRRRRFATPHGVPPADDTYSSWGNEALWQ